MEFVGDIPDGLCVLHHCDTRNCCEPTHLFVGTKMDNFKDMIQKGRQKYQSKGCGGSAAFWEWMKNNPEKILRGEKAPNAKLTDEKVRTIRSLYATTKTSFYKLGAAFGVGHKTIREIVIRKSWKHVV